MKKSILIFGIILITIIQVNCQIMFTNDKDVVVTEEQNSLNLYNSVYNDFENYYTKSILEEENQDKEDLNIYEDLFNELSLRDKIKEESDIDSLSLSIYESLVDLFKKKS